MPTQLPHEHTVGILITQGHWGGAQRYVFDLATSLAPGTPIHVGVGSPEHETDLQQRLEAWNTAHPNTPIQVEQLQHLTREISIVRDIRACIEVRQFIIRNNITLLHCNSAKAMVVGACASVLLAIRRVITIHGFTSTEPLSRIRKSFYAILERLAARTADFVICPDLNSYTIARTTFHIPKSKLAHIPHTIAAPAFLSRSDAREALAKYTRTPITSQTQIIATIANLYRVKNQALLLRGFAVLAKRNPHAICILIGAGSEQQSLEQLRATLLCSNRIFLVGAIEEAAKLLPGFDVFALTSDKEGYPYVLLEARAAGIPIATRAVGGCAEIIADLPNACRITDPTPVSVAEALTSALQYSITTQPTTTHSMPEATKAIYDSLIPN
jgi:glycosyltransferase involved in cell wall biosynthesis